MSCRRNPSMVVRPMHPDSRRCARSVYPTDTHHSRALRGRRLGRPTINLSLRQDTSWKFCKPMISCRSSSVLRSSSLSSSRFLCLSLYMLLWDSCGRATACSLVWHRSRLNSTSYWQPFPASSNACATTWHPCKRNSRKFRPTSDVCSIWTVAGWRSRQKEREEDQDKDHQIQRQRMGLDRFI